ncbi:RNA polymerase I associated factor, A49-like protein [Pilobolus umbonatus]|nr:RNA polymerase I associated factor, A49-like protein [Pilobolus umbonatus]
MGKRKHSEEETSRNVKISVYKPTEADIETPILAAFPGFKPTSDMIFNVYKNKNSTIKNEPKCIVTGETEKVSFNGANFGDNAVSDDSCRYIVGVYSKKENTLQIARAPIMKMSREVKSLKSISAVRKTAGTKMEDRTQLGLAFGTAKAKQQLKMDKRNMVTGEEMADKMDTLHTEINKAAVNIPKHADIKKSMENSLPIPPYDKEATSPDEVYDLTAIVTEEELQALTFKEILKETTLEGIQSHLAFPESKFVSDRLLSIICSTGKKDRKRVRVLMYINILMAYYVRVHPSSLKNRRKIEAALKNPPSIVIDGLTERYTEANHRTPMMADKILLYMFTLILSISGYNVVLELLAKDLSLKPSKITQLFKSLGCKVDVATAEECSEVNNRKAKKATLVLPLKFPEVRNMKRK